ARDAVGADAPEGAGVAIDPGGPAHRLAGLAVDRHRFLLALVERIDLVAAGPHALASVELDHDGARILVPDEERHLVGGGRRGEEQGDKGEANHRRRPEQAATMARTLPFSSSSGLTRGSMP